MNQPSALTLLWRGLILRCPNCGKGKLFTGIYAMPERCPVCGWVFEREEGYWTGAMAVNLVISELIMATAAIVLAVVVTLNHGPLALVVTAGIFAAALLPFLLYRHSKSLWMSIDFMIHPVDQPGPGR
jgi:uncharacterized protein (DUF983 family)